MPFSLFWYSQNRFISTSIENINGWYFVGFIIIFMNKGLLVILSVLAIFGAVFYSTIQDDSEFQMWKNKFGVNFSEG